MIAQTWVFGRPVLTVTDPPALSMQQVQITDNDLGGDSPAFSSDWTTGAAFDAVGTAQIAPQMLEALVSQPFALEIPNVIRTDVGEESDGLTVVVDFDSYGLLEIGGDFEGVFDLARGQAPEPLSLARFNITGQVIDGTTGAVIAGAVVRLFDADTNIFMGQTVSNAGGFYAFSVFDLDNYFLTAHVGQNPAGVTRRDVVGN
jgi:peptidoglycan hydrolase-like protein with peptidoglycan-binding domain